MKNEFVVEQHFSENISNISQTDFQSWFNEIEGFSLRSERFYSDISNYMMINSTDEHLRKAFKYFSLWLEAAFNAGKESVKNF